jgi:hypothetical protein
MIEASLLAIVVIATVNVIAAILTLRSSLRSEGLGEGRYELLHDQQKRLELMREEQRTLSDQLERESRERRQLVAYLEETDPRLTDNLERRRQAHVANEREVERLEQEYKRVTEELEQERRRRLEMKQLAEQLEQERKAQSRVRQDAQRLGQERQQLMEGIETEREQRVATQQQAEGLEEEHQRVVEELEHERRRQQEILQRAVESGISRPWWRRLLPVVGLLIGILIAWLTSLMVALTMLTS